MGRIIAFVIGVLFAAPAMAQIPCPGGLQSNCPPIWVNQLHALHEALAAATTGSASFSIIPGVAPTSPTNGDLWVTSTGWFGQAGGVTIPLGGGGGTPGGSNGQVQVNSSSAFGGLTNAQLTADINSFTRSLSGSVPAPGGGGTTRYLGEDGNWTVPPGSGGITWPATGDVVIANGTSSPGGVAPAGTNCLVSSGGSWTTGACAGGGYALPDIIGTYGADPSGGVDATTAFQAAGASGHGVIVESGTYKISGTVPITTNTYLIGVGQASTTVTSTSTNAPMFTLANGVNHAGISGMTLTRSVTAVLFGEGIVTASNGAFDDVEQITFTDLDIKNQWYGMVLGPTNWSLVRDVILEHNLADGLTMLNTTGNSSVGSNPLQWTLDHVLSQFNAGRGFSVAGVAETKSPAPPISIGEWKNISTFANNGVGIGVFGAPTVPIWGVRLGSNSFIGGDGSTEIYLDTWGGNHLIEADIELAGTGPTGPGCPGACTPPTNIGYGIFVTGANTGVNIKANVNANSNDGIFTQANLFGALTAPTQIHGSQITNNGVAGTSGARSGVTLASGSGGGLAISGGYIGCWNFNPTFCTQQYGLNIATDKISSVGAVIAAGNNASAPYFTSVTLTTNSCLDGLAGGTCGGGGGSGNVSGPGSSTNGYLPQWSGTGGTNLSTGVPVGTSGNNTVIETTGSGLVLPGILPVATTGAFGAVKPDGSSITISGGVLSATTGGGGTMTSLTGILNGGVTFSPTTVTTSGTAFLTPCANNLLLANISGFSQSPLCLNISSYLDSAVSSTTGVILNRNGGGWTASSPTTLGLAPIASPNFTGANPPTLNGSTYLALSPVASLANPGYIAFPISGTANNYLRQWGNATIASGTSVAVTFPFACAHAILGNPQVTPAASGGVQVSAAAGSVTLSGFTIFAVNSATGGSITSQPFNWSMECY